MSTHCVGRDEDRAPQARSCHLGRRWPVLPRAPTFCQGLMQALLAPAPCGGGHCRFRLPSFLRSLFWLR